MLIGRRLRDFRLRCGLTLEQLEDRSGLESTYLSRLEDDLEVPSYGDLEILSGVLDAPLRQFLYDGEKPVPTPKLTPRVTLQELAEERLTLRNARVRPDSRHSPEGTAASSRAGQSARIPESDTGTRNWAQTRLGQVALFWGVLQLVLRALDTMTRLDMVKMLRESLVSGLQFLVDPRVALLLLAVAFVVLWESNHTRKSAKPALADLADEPGAKRYGVFGATATPFFLALVCGVSLVAVGWRSASREQLTHLSASTPISSLSMQHDTSPSVKKRPARVPALSGGQPSSSGEAEPLVSSLPPLTPEIDQPDQRATMTGNENQLTANPSGLGAVASHNSPSEHWGLTPAQDSPSANAVRKKTLDRIEQARRDKNWRLMATLSEDAIAQSPQWLTPYELAGEAYVQTGDIDRAIARLEYVKMSGAGSLGDGWAVVEAARLRESIRHRYGR